MALGKLRDPKKETFWRRMVRTQASSVLSVRAWCRRRGLREATFYWWRAELARRDVERPTFVPVRVTDDVSGGGEARIEIVLSGGQRVLVHGQVDRQMLAEVLAMVTSTNSVEPKGQQC